MSVASCLVEWAVSSGMSRIASQYVCIVSLAIEPSQLSAVLSSSGRSSPQIKCYLSRVEYNRFTVKCLLEDQVLKSVEFEYDS